MYGLRCGYGAVVDGQGGPRAAGSSGLDAVGRKARSTPRADQLNRGDVPIRLTLAPPWGVFDVGKTRPEGRAVERFCLPTVSRGRS